jgi:dihydrolipoamide dehydrogenase
LFIPLRNKVSVVEMMPGLLPGADKDLVIHLSKRLEKSFDKIMLDSKVVEMKEEADGLQVKIQNKNGEIAEQKYDYVLISIGRKPDTSGLDLENTLVKVNQRGWIIVNEQMRTNDPEIYRLAILLEAVSSKHLMKEELQ